MIRSKKHLKFINSLPCCNCSKPSPSEAAHIRAQSDGGTGMKPSDNRTVPLCHECHREQHNVGEYWFWKERLEDAINLSNALWIMTGNTKKGTERVLRFKHTVYFKEK